MASRAVPRYIEELLDPYSGSTGGKLCTKPKQLLLPRH